MIAHRSIRLLRGLTALAVTLLLLVGVPLGLILLVGWPLPTSIPTSQGFSRAMQIGIGDEFVVNAITVLAWIAWAQLAIAIVSQSVGAVRCRSVARVPVAPGVQALAARLVTGIILLSGSLQPARAGAAPMPVPVVVEVQPTSNLSAENVIDLRPLAPVRSADRSRPVVTPGDAIVTVQRHDSYWAIAERTLGDGLRWREIHDLNIGRSMGDGHVIATGDDTLRAGWELAVPSGAAIREPMVPSRPTLEGAGEEIVVESGDNLWDLAEGQLESDLQRPPTDVEVTPYWGEVMETNHDRLVEPDNPNLIFPGQVLVMPATGHVDPRPEAPTQAPSSITPAPQIEPSPTASTAPEPTTGETPTTEEPYTSSAPSPEAGAESPKTDTGDAVELQTLVDTAHDGDSSSLPAALAVGGLSSLALAVGIKRLINKRRRGYASSHDGQAPPPSDPDQRDLHQTVVAMADENRLDDLQLILGSLAVGLAETESSRRPRVVRHSVEVLEILLDSPSTDAPPGWTVEGDGLVWTFDGALDPEGSDDLSVCPAPLLVTIGQPEDDAQLYLDLEVDGVVALAGDIEVARDLARSMLTELALAPLADTLQVIVIGDLVESDASHLDHLRMVETWDDIAEDLTFWARESHEVLCENGWPNTFIARGSDPDHDALVPIVVIATKPPPPDLLAVLVETRPSAVAIVVADQFEGAVTSIHCAEDALTLDDVELSFVPQAVDAEELEAMGRLLVFNELAATESEVERSAATLAEPSDGGETQQRDLFGAGEIDAAIEPPDYDVLVRLLGDIRVEGGIKPLNAKPTAVVAYLALNRMVTADRLEEACWFGSDGTSHRKRLLDAMSECRGVLGRTHFPANRDGTYKVDGRIRTDLELFNWHVGRAAAQGGPDSLSSYRTALDLVTGRPFTYANAARKSFGWVDFEHHATTWEHKVTCVAKAFAELCIDLERHDEAIDQLRYLLRAIPLSGGLVEALMRVHLATGDRAAAEALYQEHAKALDQAGLGDPDESVEQLRFSLADGPTSS